MDVKLLAHRITGGHRIRWAGIVDGAVEVLMLDAKGKEYMVAIHIDTDEESMPQLLCGEPGSEMLHTTVLPRSGDLGELRWASIHGVNVGGSCKPGSGMRPLLPGGCVCGYDIETDISATTGDAFPLPESRIISLAVWCDCGYKLLITTEKYDAEGVISVANSAELIEEFCCRIVEHRPMWLVGWNSYAFDNYCMLVHSPDSVARYFDRTVIRTTFGNKVGYILNFPGTYNVDLYAYLDRTQRDRYPQLSLGVVAKQLGAPEKMQMPDMDESGIEAMLEYNMNDSKVTAMLWGMTGADHDIPNMACVSCSPVYDCIRYVTGSMSACVIASQCLREGTCFGWAKCLPMGKYQGGYVVAPTRGIHDDVAVCDFSSMYPTIMIGGNISPDSIVPPRGSARVEGAVSWDGEGASVVYGGTVLRFRNDIDPVIPRVLRRLVSERKANRSKFPHYAVALKVATNSIYGALGYEFSPLYSPSCSAATTAFGRWCLSLSIGIFERCGLEVVYGDTDSCFLAKTHVTVAKYGGSLKDHCNAALKVLRGVLAHTPFAAMDMALEGLHKRMLLLEKKNYAYMASNNGIRYKGISVARKDALGICRKVSKCTVDMILNGGNTPDTRAAVALMLSTALDSCALGSLTLSDVSKVVRGEGGNCYRYIDFNGNAIDLKIEDESPNSYVEYSRSDIAGRIAREVTRYTSAGGLGRAHDIVWSCPVFGVLGCPSR